MKIIDSYQRHMRKVRLSLLDACQFRCTYCMPLNPKFMKANQWMSVEQIDKLCRQLFQLGVEQVRITGGEPTLRPDFMKITEKLSDIGFAKLGVTTNGQHLEKFLPDLLQTQCRHINVSLDSLSESGFNQITRTNFFKPTYRSILKAKEMGFQVKVNVVAMRGLNDHEILDFVKFSEEFGIDVRFLELMRIGQARPFFDDQFISADEIIGIISQHTQMTSVSVEHDATAFLYRTTGGGRVGFIASETRPFCNSCSRLRVSANGSVRPCLMSDKEIRVVDMSTQELYEALNKLILLKPITRIEQTAENMNSLGG